MRCISCEDVFCCCGGWLVFVRLHFFCGILFFEEPVFSDLGSEKQEKK